MPPLISVVVPAHNEEAWIERCLASIRRAAERLGRPVETIVVLNRCTDRTQMIAEEFGARTVVDDRKNLAAIRNSGARVATGDIIATIDADSWMSAGMLSVIAAKLSKGNTIGGGVLILPERLSLGIFVTGLCR